MKLYNTLSRQIEDFQPQDAKQVKVYNCGPTVYDHAHLGNLRAYVFTDTLRRALEANGYGVKQVMNITDVGHLQSDEDEGHDKLEAGAARESKTVWQVADFYTAAFKRDIARLNILSPNGYHDPKRGDNYARATDFIDQQKAIVQRLLDKGFAYITQQAIYFDITKLDDYGQLTGQKLADKEVGARQEVVTDPHKRHPQDFAVWFFSVGRFKDHSLRWQTDWGEGFPGWHLECSAIIHTTLGEPIDIHTGGVDHIGTHHTNEIAQTEAAYGQKLSNYWLHNEHLLVDNRKMAKSLGNFYTLEDVIKRGYDPLALRLLFLQSHYRSQMNFTWGALDGAQSRLERWRALADLRWQTSDDVQPEFLVWDWPISRDYIKSHLVADLNTPQALITVDEAADKAVAVHANQLKPFVEFLGFLDAVFGLKLAKRPDIEPSQKELIKQREAARKAKDWSKADELRQKLADEGIEISDTVYGPIWNCKG